MTSISPYLSERYSEESYPFTESEYEEVMAAPSTLYIDPRDGKVKQTPEPPSRGRLGGIEL
jgi:hypothetical protein